MPSELARDLFIRMTDLVKTACNEKKIQTSLAVHLCLLRNISITGQKHLEIEIGYLRNLVGICSILMYAFSCSVREKVGP